MLLSHSQDAIALVADLNGLEPGALGGVSDVLEENLATSVQACGKTLDDPIVDSLKYLRLRRNHFVHSGDVLSEAFRVFIRYRSPSLNEYWNVKEELDFAAKEPGRFSETEAMRLFAVMRTLLLRTDETLGECFDEHRVLQRLAQEVRDAHPEHRGADALPRLARKVAYKAFLEYGLTIPIEQGLAVVSDL